MAENKNISYVGINSITRYLTKLKDIFAPIKHSHAITDVTDLQSTLNAKQATITGGASTITSNNLTANRALISNGSGKVATSDVTSTELGYLDGVTSNVQTQLNAKAPTENPDFTGTVTVVGSVNSQSASIENITTGKIAIGSFIITSDSTNDRLMISHT